MIIDLSKLTSAAIPGAVAAAKTTDLIYVGPEGCTTSGVVKVPAGPNFEGWGPIKLTAPGATWWHEDPGGIIRGLVVDGTGVSSLPLKMGTGAGGRGAKVFADYIEVRRPAPGGRAAEIHNLQNSHIVDFRIADADAAKDGLVIENGCKNVVIGALWSGYMTGYALKVTTSGGTQLTSKIRVLGGLTEGSEGYLLEACEDVTVQGVCLNGGGRAAAVTLAAGGMFKGKAIGPTRTTLDGIIAKSFAATLLVKSPADVMAGGWSSACEVGYQINSTGVKVDEFRNHPGVGKVRFASTCGQKEGDVVTAS